MTQTVRRVPGQRSSSTRRPGAVYAHTTRRVDRHGMPVDGVEDGYIGRSRDVARRTLQHAGLAPQRTGEVAEAPWNDLRVGEVRILEQGVWTDDELDARERYWIATLQPRFNDRDNPRPDRIRKLEARRHRDARDVAKGLAPRVWEPARPAPVVQSRGWPAVKVVLRSRWTWWAVAWLVTFAAMLDNSGQDLPTGSRALGATALLTAVWASWRLWGRRRWRRFRRRW